MSIQYIVGNPGSGKTYLAVYKLYENFLFEPKNKDVNPNNYLYAYTNINEFNFSCSDLILPLDLENLYDKLTDLYNLYLDKANDQELIEKAKELEIYKSLFVIDECHSNIFDKKKDKILIWWLTYHRHLYQDIWLITQNLSLVDSCYKKIAEFFYKAVDGSNRLFSKRFKYVLFNSPTMYNKRDIVPGGGISLKYDPEIFNLYHSGNITKHKSFIKVYMFIAFILFIVVFIFFLKFISFFDSNDKNDLNSTNKNLPIKTFSSTSKPYFKPINPDDKTLDLFLYNIKCFDGICNITQLNQNITTKFLTLMIKENTPYFSDIHDNVLGERIFTLAFKQDIFKFLKTERLNDEKNNTFNYDSVKLLNSNRN